MFNFQSKKFSSAVIMGTVLFLLCLVTFIVLRVNEAKFSSWVSVDATINRLVQDGNSFIGYVNFVFGGVPYTDVQVSGYLKNVKEGDPITVRINPLSPKDGARLPTSYLPINIGLITLMVVSLGCIAIGIYLKGKNMQKEHLI